MRIRVGFEMVYQCPAPTPMILALNIHYSRASDLVRPDHLVTFPAVPLTAYRDLFGNWCSRLVAPPGRFVLSTDALVNDTGARDVVAEGARQVPVEQLPKGHRRHPQFRHGYRHRSIPSDPVTERGQQPAGEPCG